MPATDPQRYTETISIDLILSASVDVEIEVGKDNTDYVQHQIHDAVKQDGQRLFYLENLEVEDYE